MRGERVTLTPSACPTGRLYPQLGPFVSEISNFVAGGIENPPWLGKGDFNEQVPGPAEGDF